MSILFKDLHRLLSEYKPTDLVQKKFQTQIQNYGKTKEILWAEYFNPGHITVSALVLSPDNKNIALIFHPFLKLWLQPGGHLEDHDPSLLDAAKREVLEEVSISDLSPINMGIFDLDIHRIPENPTKNQPSHQHLDLRFLFQANTWDCKASSEIKESKWVPLSEIARINTDDSVKRLISKFKSLS